MTFKVGDEPLPNFRIIERHYFQNQLVKSFDFKFGFCIPGSTNTWEAVYDVPPLDDALIEEMVHSPFETQSDSFYFVGNELIIHNKASYKYTTTPDRVLPLSLNRGYAEAKMDDYTNQGGDWDCYDNDTKCNSVETSHIVDELKGVKISSPGDDCLDSYAESKDDSFDGNTRWTKESHFEAK